MRLASDDLAHGRFAGHPNEARGRENMGQFERTLIIAEPGSHVHYVEGCAAPTYSSD